MSMTFHFILQVPSAHRFVDHTTIDVLRFVFHFYVRIRTLVGYGHIPCTFMSIIMPLVGNYDLHCGRHCKVRTIRARKQLRILR